MRNAGLSYYALACSELCYLLVLFLAAHSIFGPVFSAGKQKAAAPS